MTKTVSMKKMLSPQQEKTMKKHSVHHTKKHMATMRKEMLAGKSFSKAHTIAMKDGK